VHHDEVAPNILDRQFAAERPNQRWVGDTTELLIGTSEVGSGINTSATSWAMPTKNSTLSLMPGDWTPA